MLEKIILEVLVELQYETPEQRENGIRLAIENATGINMYGPCSIFPLNAKLKLKEELFFKVEQFN